MSARLHFGVTLALTLILSYAVWAQSDDAMSLADVARATRAKRVAAAAAVIDNDNLAQVMDQAATGHKDSSLGFTIEQSGKRFDVVSPDATCSLSFNANATALLSAPVVPSALPPSDLARIEGPATLEDGVLQISLHNGSDWSLREITVALIIVQPEPDDYGTSLKLVPASEKIPELIEKQPETTLLLHLKGAAAPHSSAVFQDKLGDLLTPDEDWHWSILQAKGIPSEPVASSTDPSAGN